MLKPAQIAMLNTAAALIQSGQASRAFPLICTVHRIAEKDMTLSPHILDQIRIARAALAIA